MAWCGVAKAPSITCATLDSTHVVLPNRLPDHALLVLDAADPELTRILMDPRMQAVMQECSKPGRMAMFMQSPEHGPKLRRLLRAGLLQMV